MQECGNINIDQLRLDHVICEFLFQVILAQKSVNAVYKMIKVIWKGGSASKEDDNDVITALREDIKSDEVRLELGSVLKEIVKVGRDQEELVRVLKELKQKHPFKEFIAELKDMFRPLFEECQKKFKEEIAAAVAPDIDASEFRFERVCVCFLIFSIESCQPRLKKTYHTMRTMKNGKNYSERIPT